MNAAMVNPIRVEIVSRDEYWRKAVLVEWQHEFPERVAIADGERSYLIEAFWLTDLERVASKCFSTIVHAPANSSRRQLLRRLLALDAGRRT